jgi:hypothetical protein
LIETFNHDAVFTLSAFIFAFTTKNSKGIISWNFPDNSNKEETVFNDRNRKALKFEDFEVRFESVNRLPLNIFRASGFKRDKPSQWRSTDLYIETTDKAFLRAELVDGVAVSINGTPVHPYARNEAQKSGLAVVELKGSNVIKIRVKTDEGGKEYHLNIHVVKKPVAHLEGRPKQISYNEEDDCFFFEMAMWWMFWIDSFYYDDPTFYEEELYWEPHDEWVGEFAEFQDFDQEFPASEHPEQFPAEASEVDIQSHDTSGSTDSISVEAVEPEPDTIRYEPPEPTHSYTPETDTKHYDTGGYDSGSSYDSGGSCDSGGGGDCGGCD